MPRGSLLEDLLPRYDFDEVHTRVVAPPDRVFEAVKAVTLDEMPLVRLLFALRSLPARLAGGRGLPQAKDEPLFAQMVEFGFTGLAEDPRREVVAGVVAQLWKRGGKAASIADGGEFVAFDRPGLCEGGDELPARRARGRHTDPDRNPRAGHRRGEPQGIPPVLAHHPSGQRRHQAFVAARDRAAGRASARPPLMWLSLLAETSA
jgi:hypothetical protein